MRIALLFVSVIFFAALSCAPPATPAPEKKEIFPFDRPGLENLRSFLLKYPQIKEVGYVFKDHEFINDELMVPYRPKNVTFPTIVNWINFKKKSYEDKSYFPKYYEEILRKLKVPKKEFDAARRQMTASYLEGMLMEKDWQLFFMDRPMGTFQGYLYAPEGRKGLGETFLFRDVDFRVVEDFGGNWFGVEYP